MLKVKGRAKQLGLEKKDYPSHQTVYSIIDRYVEEQERKKKARSPGYFGSRLTHITTLLVYERLSDGTEQFLDYAHAQGLETESLSYRELKAINKQLNQENESINNDRVLDAMLDR